MDKGKKGKGAPTKYDASFNERVYRYSLLGLTDKEMSDLLGICEATFNNWKHEHFDFLESLTRGKIESDVDMAVSLHKRGKGYEYTERVVTYKDDATEDNEEGLKPSETKIFHKHMPADTAAAKHWLANRRNLLWKANADNQEDTDKNHNGTINITFNNKGVDLPSSEDDIKDFVDGK
jgi:hypothetical protein